MAVVFHHVTANSTDEIGAVTL